MPYFFRKLEKMSQNLSSAAIVIGALQYFVCVSSNLTQSDFTPFLCYQNKETIHGILILIVRSGLCIQMANSV